jgi:hypothetical protein
MMDEGRQVNIPNPDPSLATNQRLAEAMVQIRAEVIAIRAEAKSWIDNLQTLVESKIKSAEDATASLDRVVQTRLAGSETALNAAMAASDKVVAKIEIGVGSVMNEMKAGFSKQIDSMNDKIDDLKERMSESGGKDKGMGSAVVTGIAILAAVAAIGMFVLTFMRSNGAISLRSPVSITQPF